MKFLLASISYGEIEGEMLDGNLFIHFTYNKNTFTLSCYKEMLSIWSDVLQGLKGSGIETIYSCISKDEDMVNKFQGMFGLVEYMATEQAIVYRMEL